METNVCIISSVRRPFRSFLLFLLFGLISFGFITKAVELLVVQRETEVLGSYYRSIGVLENIKDPQSDDVVAGIKLIKTSPDFAYGDQRRIASGVMSQTYNEDLSIANHSIYNALPKERWPNVHETDIWFIGELINKEEVKNDKRIENKTTIGYYLDFKIDTVLASYPDNARQGFPIGLLFMFQGNEAVIPLIQEMEVGQRYFIRCWFDLGFLQDEGDYWENTHATSLQIIPLNDKQLWYIPVAKGGSIDFSNPEMATIKNDIDVLNENLHTLPIISTSDLSAMPRTQEASRMYYLTEGRWLNHQDELAGSKLIVVDEGFAHIRGFKLGDEIQLTFRPLKDTYYGLIRDGIDTSAWRTYPTYRETFRIVGLCNSPYGGCNAYIPNSSLAPGFESSTELQFCGECGYSFTLNSSRNQTDFIQEYKAPLEELGISLTFLENNGEAYWASVDPIRRSLSADVLIYGVLMIVALVLAVFLYMIQHRREYAILRTLGVAKKQTNWQFAIPLLGMAGLGIITGGIPAWNYAITQAKTSLSTLPTPAGVYPSADLNSIYLGGLIVAIFLLLVFFSWLGLSIISNKSVFELLQGQISKSKVAQKQVSKVKSSETMLSVSYDSKTISGENPAIEPAFNKNIQPIQRNYNPSSLSQYVLHHMARSKFKSFLTLAIALVFMFASGWILRAMEQSQKEVDRLYDTTVVEADIIRDISGTSFSRYSGFISGKAIDSVLKSGFVKSSILEASTSWIAIGKSDSQDATSGIFPVYAYNNPETLASSLLNLGSLVFAPGWDISLFTKQWTLEEIHKNSVPAVFPNSLLEQLQLNMGEVVRITDQFSQTYSCVIVGQYSGERVVIRNTIKLQFTGFAGDSILVPLSVVESMEGSQTFFDVAHFILDPKKNRELPQFQIEMDKVMKEYSSGVGGRRFIIWDEELKLVVAQLEKNISLLQVLYPVLIAVSVLIGAGLCFLLLLQEAKQAAILRMLGTTKMVVRLALISEPFLLSIIGVLIGLIIFRFLWSGSSLVPVGQLLLGAGLYLAGALAGLVIGAISVTNKKPMELLQVKE